MSRLLAGLHREANGEALLNPNYGIPAIAVPGAFGVAARGTNGGAKDPMTIFTVTGIVAVKILGLCTLSLVSAGGGTIQLGTVGSLASFIAATTATTIATGELWVDATADTDSELASGVAERIIAGSIQESINVADITAGNINYYAWWWPLSPDANLVSAFPA